MGAEQALPEEGLRREVGFGSLLWFSTGTTLGSGWLFSAFVALSIAGPAVLISWFIATAMILLLALIHAELGAMFPESGGTGRYPGHAFGPVAEATFGWFSYLQASTIVPIEILAAIQYLSTASWAHGLYNSDRHALSGSGALLAVALMGAFVLVNLLGIGRLTRANSVVTIWKVAIPTLAVLALVLTNFHGSNFSAVGGFFPSTGSTLEGILLAIPSGGIVFALMGFEGALQVGGESANPGRDLPRAVIGGMLLCAAIYIAVQIAFIAALEPSSLAHLTTWSQLGKGTSMAQAPLFELSLMVGLGWLAWLLRVDAVISPSGTGMLYLTGASRLAFGLARDGYVPKALATETRRTEVPRIGIVVTAILGLAFMLPFPSWTKLVNVVTAAAVLMYAGAPLALGALRRTRPEATRPYRLRLAPLLAPLGFVVANFIVYWTGWQTVSTLMVALLLGWGLMALSRAGKFDERPPVLDFSAFAWLAPYLVGITLCSYFGGFGPGGMLGGVGPFAHILVGGQGQLGLWWDLGVVTVLSLGVYGLAMAHASRRATRGTMAT